MSKSRPLSIYLLKPDFNATNALKDDHGLDGAAQASNLPQGATLFVLDNMPSQPWWRGYFGISKQLPQVSKGALVFLNVGTRCFALSFGHVYHNLKEESYEYDFGLRVTLNCADPKKVKSTDVLEPSEARRKTTQPSIPSDLTYFDFDRDSNILKKLTGTVKKEYEDLFKQVTGSSNLRISSSAAAADLPGICEKLFALYESNEYETTFPGIRNIEPVKDPELINKLNEKLLAAFRANTNDESVALTVPDIINYEEKVYSCFLGCGERYLYGDVYLGNYYIQLESAGVALTDVTIETLRQHKLAMTDDNGIVKDEYRIFKCLVFDTQLDDTTECYHLCDGSWYKVENDYITKLHDTLDGYYEDQSLPDYNHATEGAYNIAVAESNNAIICLDTENTSPAGQTQIEPCDLYTVTDGKAVLYHVKVSTLSASLSHLFNQGVNSIEIIKSEPLAKEKFQALLKEKMGSNIEAAYLSPVGDDAYKVVYTIISRKEKGKKSTNLPLFSRISLMRSIKALHLMNVKPVFCFVNNTSPKKQGKKKPRKKAA